MPTVNGWRLLFHDCLLGQLDRLVAAVERARASDPVAWRGNANARLLATLTKLILETIPADPGHARYLQGNTLGEAHRHWLRAKFSGRFRLFFRYDSASRIIVYAWVNDERTKRKAGSRSDPYALFRKMLDQGNPPDAWDKLVTASKPALDPRLRQTIETLSTDP